MSEELVCMSNSKLVDYVQMSPNYTKINNKKNKKISIHHMAGNLTVETCGNVFASKNRQASSNYGIGTDGRIGLYVDEGNRSWCTSSRDNDKQAITIEVANDGGAPNWHVSDKALSRLIDLCVDICQRNGIEKLQFTGDKTGNVTLHKWFANTNCPGPYLESKIPYVVQEVNKRLGVKDDVPYKVKVTANALNIRSGAGVQYKSNGCITDKGVYTIVAEDKSGQWGKLKSGKGYIHLNYTKKIE